MTGHIIYPETRRHAADNSPVDCLWVIEAPTNTTVVVKFSYYITHRSTPCKDFLQVNVRRMEESENSLLCIICTYPAFRLYLIFMGFCTPFFIEDVPVFLSDATHPVSKPPRYAVLRATLFILFNAYHSIFCTFFVPYIFKRNIKFV